MDLAKETLDSPNCFAPMEWGKGLDQSGLLSLLFMPHFGRSIEVNTYVKQLLVEFHGGYMWLDKAYSVDVNLILEITGLPQVGVDPMSFLKKDKDPSMIVRDKDKYDVVRANIGFLISSINDHTIHFIMKILSCKML